MKKSNVKLLTEMFLVEDNSTFDRNGREDMPSFNNDNFEIKRRLFYNSLYAHKVNTNKNSYNNEDYIDDKFITRFFPKIWLLIFIIVIGGLVFLMFNPTNPVPYNVAGKIIWSGMKYTSVVFLPTFIIIFFLRFRLNLKYYRVIRDFKIRKKNRKNEIDDQFVDDMINNNLAFYRKLKLQKINKLVK